MKTSKPIKVLQVIDSFGMGGAETWLVRQTEFFNRHPEYGISFDFLATSGNTGHFDDYIKSLGCKIFYCPLNKTSIPSFIRSVRKILKQNRYAAIHDHQDFLSGWHFLFAVNCLPKVRIAHVHNASYQLRANYGVNFRRKVIQSLGKKILRIFATHITGTSNQLIKEYDFSKKQFPKQWIGNLYCAFTIADWSGNHLDNKNKICRELGLSDNTKIVLFVGRFDISLDVNHPKNNKNSLFAAQIFKELEKDKAVLIMIGANDFIKEAFQNYCRSIGIENKVKLLGIRNDVKTFMLGSDVLLFPSRAEGLGVVGVEAQAAGLPVLASATVPKECMVLEKLIDFVPLEKGPKKWAEILKAKLESERGDSTENDPRWVTSEFNIEVTAKKMERIFRGDPLI